MPRLPVAVAVALVWLLAACAGGGEPPPATPTAAAGPAVPWEGTVATVDGGALAGADFVRRDVALWFWAPW